MAQKTKFCLKLCEGIMEKREMICIMCPLGCHLTVTKDGEKLRLKKVKYGDVIIKNILNTGADVVITAND